MTSARQVVVIPARYESTRLPGKPLVELCGVPMVVRTWQRCREVVADDQLVVATEDAAPGSFGAESGVDLTQTMERLARKKLRSLGSVDPETRARRLYAFLARRGYDRDDIRRVLTRLSAGEVHDSSSA